MTLVAILFLSLHCLILTCFICVCVKEGVQWMTLVDIYFPDHIYLCLSCAPRKNKTKLTLTECCSSSVFLLYPEAKRNQRLGSSPLKS
jgi:hypothetical protein